MKVREGEAAAILSMHIGSLHRKVKLRNTEFGSSESH